MDIRGIRPQLGNIIVFTKYNRNSKLYLGRIIGFTKNNNPRVIVLDKDFKETETFKWNKNTKALYKVPYIKAIITDYIIIKTD